VKLARVVGTVVSTINVPVFEDRKLLLCDLLAPDGTAAGGYQIAVDVVGAGVGETVLLMDEGNSARQILAAPEAPVRTVVVGIVDEVSLAGDGVTVGGPPAGTRPTRGRRSTTPRRKGTTPGRKGASTARRRAHRRAT
jgi:ethanolamine utilization protein EutN